MQSNRSMSFLFLHFSTDFLLLLYVCCERNVHWMLYGHYDVDLQCGQIRNPSKPYKDHTFGLSNTHTHWC